jgi:hypothetical protein
MTRRAVDDAAQRKNQGPRCWRRLGPQVARGHDTPSSSFAEISMRSSFIVYAAALAALVVGCSVSSSAPGASAGDPATDCQARCSAKAVTCNAPSSSTSSRCASVCGSSPSEAEMTCLESASCHDLVAGGIPSKCKAPSDTPDSGGGGALQKLGGSCSCGAGATFCSSASGPCEAGLTCFNGRCHGAPCDITASSKKCPASQTCDLAGSTTGWCE